MTDYVMLPIFLNEPQLLGLVEALKYGFSSTNTNAEETRQVYHKLQEMLKTIQKMKAGLS